jgi:hypothetical protein
MMTKVTRATRVAAVLMLLGLIYAAPLTYADDLALYAALGVTPNRAVMAVQGRLQQTGYYNGPVTGVVDLPTAAANRPFSGETRLTCNRRGRSANRSGARHSAIAREYGPGNSMKRRHSAMAVSHLTSWPGGGRWGQVK